jgi:hypothetical protein
VLVRNRWLCHYVPENQHQGELAMKNKLIVSASFVLLLSIAATVYAQVAQRTAPAAEVWEYAEVQLSESESAVPS